MANEPIFNVASFDSRVKLCSAQTVVETKLLPAGGISIAKVLSYCAVGSVTASEVFTGEARVRGTVIFRVLFLDAEGYCRNMEVSSDFSEKITSELIANATPQIVSKILDTDILSVDKDEIKLAAIVEMELLDNIPVRIKYLQYAGENVYTSDTTSRFLKLVGKVHDSFVLSNSTAVTGEKVLMVESNPILLKRTAQQNSVVVEGEIVSNIVTERDGNIYSSTLTTPFVQEVGMDGCSTECTADITLSITNTNAAIAVNDDSDSLISLDFGMVVDGMLYTTEEMSIITDAFSITNELSLTTTDVTLAKNAVATTVFERVEGSVTLGHDMPAIDNILAVMGGRVHIANAYTVDGRLVIEGMVNASIIYFSGETGGKNSVDVELPFSLTTDEDMEGNVLSTTAVISHITSKIRRGNEIDIKADIAVNISGGEEQTLRVISDLKMLESIELPSSAISLHIARPKETLWDVAKALKSTPELILLQNPELSVPLQGGERVIIYRHLKR